MIERSKPATELGGLHHLTAVTGNAPVNLAFYTQVLGMRQVKQTVNQDDVSAYHLFYGDELGAPGTELTFFDWPGIGPNVPGTGAITETGLRIGGDSLVNMAWSFEELTAYASRGAWVRAGDVLGSGTCGGGCLAELWGRTGRREPPPLAVGDVVTMSVEGIGTISNRVVAGADPVPVPRARSARVEV